MLPLVIYNGLIDSLNPCAIGVLLLFVSLIFTLGASKRQLISFGLFYLAAMYVTYLLIGLGLIHTFHLFGVHNFFGWTAAFIVLFLGLFALKDYFFPYVYVPVLSPIISACKVPKWDRKITAASAIGLGFFVGLCEFPCTGGIYLATTALLSAKTTFWTGLGFLLIYNLMFILPTSVIFAFSTNRGILKIISKYHSAAHGKIKLISGLTMLALGLGMLVWLNL